ALHHAPGGGLAGVAPDRPAQIFAAVGIARGQESSLRFFLPDGRRWAALGRRGWLRGPDTARDPAEPPAGRAAASGAASAAAPSSCSCGSSAADCSAWPAPGALPTATLA